MKTDGNFISVRLNTLRSNVPFGFTVFLKMSDGYLRYINAEDDIEQPRLDNLKNKNVKKVFIESQEEGKYQEFLDKLLELASKDPTISLQNKTVLVASVTADAIERVYEDPTSKVAYMLTQKAASSLVSSTQATPEILKEIFNIEHDDDISISCAITTSTTAVMLARKLGLPNDKLEIISLAALLCDISLPKLGEDYQKFFTKNISEFSLEESKQYKEHPFKSAELLQDKEYSSQQVLSLIANHEEKLNGKGFPKGISKLSQEERIVSLCNRFSLLTVGMKMPKDVALKELILQDSGAYDLALINTLKSLVGNK